MSRWRNISTAMVRPRWVFTVVGLVALVLFTAFNRYPTFYNADEHIKSGFARGIEVNMNHPLLLMGSSWVVARVFHTKSSGSVIKTGRIVSALFAVATVLALMGVAWKLHGPAEGWAAGLLCAACPALIKQAHVMKEDTALAMGMALVCLAVVHDRERPSPRSAMLLGAATAAAVSAKYIGLVMLSVALLFLWRAPVNLPAAGPGSGAWRWRRYAAFAGVFVLATLCINFYYVIHCRQFVTGIRFESAHVTTGHHGLASALPLLDAAELYLIRTPWPAIALAAVGVALFAADRRRRGAAGWLMLLLPAGYFALLAASRIQSARYLLPVSLWTHYLAGVGLVGGIRLAPAGGARKLTAAAFAALLCVQGWHAAGALDRFAHDSRRQLARWASKNMPHEARVLADRYARIEPKDWKSAGIKLHFSVTSLRSAADYGTLDAARRGGFTHVAVCSMDYGRFFADRLRPVEGFAEDAAGHRRFYEQLFREGEPVWQSDAGRRPIVYMFKIAPAGKPAIGTKMRFDAVDTVEAMP